MANPNWKKNLKAPWKPGESGNPLGGKLHNPEIRKIKALTREELAEIGSLLLKGNLDELREIPKEPNASVLKVIMASVAARALEKGDYQALEVLLQRIIGKVPDKLEASVSKPQVHISLPSNSRETTPTEVKEIVKGDE